MSNKIDFQEMVNQLLLAEIQEGKLFVLPHRTK
jgi:hypothetical protein